MSERLHVKVEPGTIDGVRVYTIVPDDIPARNRDRLAVHVHGGCYVLNPREAALPEAIMLAGFALTIEMMLRTKAEHLPMPGAIAPGTPVSDVTKVGDTFATNAMVDNVLVSPDGFCDAATRFYAHGHDLADPLLSPAYGDLAGFPPAILTSGTRDLLLSNTVCANQKLREAGIETRLQIFEGQSHAQFYRDDRIPEVKEAFAEIAAFFDKHLGAPVGQ